MSGKKRRYQKPEITSNSEPRDTDVFLELLSFEVDEWHPLPDGQGEPTEVHLSVTVQGLDVPMIMRFKGPGTLDGLISALAVHRFNVWPDRD